MSPQPPLRDIIARHGLSATKALGQNFLLDRHLLDRIARVAGSLEGETVYEVGPGPGGLTRALLERGANVIGVERDQRCVAALAELVEQAEGRLSLIAADAMALDEAIIAPGAHIVSNLPYNVGTALLVRWLAVEPWPPWWRSMTLMFQKEVAERIVAPAGSPAYGRLSVLAQWRSRSNQVFSVHPSAFVPPPKVRSAVVHLVPEDQPSGVSIATVERLTAAAFGQRRKMLRQSLKRVDGGLAALENAGIDASRRAETLDIDEFVSLARAIEQHPQSTDGNQPKPRG